MRRRVISLRSKSARILRRIPPSGNYLGEKVSRRINRHADDRNVADESDIIYHSIVNHTGNVSRVILKTYRD